MYGMPIAQSLVFLAAVIILIATIQRRHLHPFLAIVVITAVFGYVAGFPTSVLVRVFGTGFSDAIYSPGLVIVAAALVAGIAETSDASDRLSAWVEHWRSRKHSLGAPSAGATVVAATMGLVAGIGASSGSAFALATPLLRPLGGKSAEQREAAATTLALATSASHGLMALSPIPIAAAAILDADWVKTALFGTPLAALVIAFGALFARRTASAGHTADSSAQLYPPPLSDRRGGGSVFALGLAVALPLLLLIVQSIGSIPSEPLGGGPRREFILGIGGPLILFLASLAAMLIGQARQTLELISDSAWTSRIFGNVVGLLLTVCAASGLQRLCQETGMATLLADHVLDWHFGAFAILIPFLVAAVLKTFQGSSLVAAITAAGMVQPLMGALNLGGANTKALAALAVGAGAMTVSHVNDDYFWLVTHTIGLPPRRGLTVFSFGTLLQGLLAAAVLLIVSLVWWS